MKLKTICALVAAFTFGSCTHSQINNSKPVSLQITEPQKDSNIIKFTFPDNVIVYSGNLNGQEVKYTITGSGDHFIVVKKENAETVYRSVGRNADNLDFVVFTTNSDSVVEDTNRDGQKYRDSILDNVTKTYDFSNQN